MLKSRYLLLSLRVLLGLIFLFAGIVKLPNIDTFAWEIEQYQIVPEFLIPFFATLLPLVEVLLGLALIFGIFQRITASISILLVLSFLTSKVMAYTRGLDIEICPCFGPAIPLFMYQSLIIDVVMLLIAVYLLLIKDNGITVLTILKKIRR